MNYPDMVNEIRKLYDKIALLEHENKSIRKQYNCLLIVAKAGEDISDENWDLDV